MVSEKLFHAAKGRLTTLIRSDGQTAACGVNSGSGLPAHSGRDGPHAGEQKGLASALDHAGEYSGWPLQIVVLL